MNFLDHLKKLKEIYLILALLFSIAVGGYNGYHDILDNIEKNTIAVETTQITMLKSIVREFERSHICVISQQEWDEYLMNYSTLLDLKIKHKMLSSKVKWTPVERKLNFCKGEM